MKKTLLLLALGLFLKVSATSLPINEKLLERFAATFPGAEKVKWSADERLSYVSFELDKMQCRIEYNNSGTVVSYRRYYSEAQLSPFILSRVREKYTQPVFGVTEYFDGVSVSYSIVLFDAKNWISLKADNNGSISRIKTYNNAQP